MRLWWRKKSVKHAWLVAMAGAFMPPYIYLYFFKDHRYTYYGLIVLNAGYGLAGLIGHEIRKRRQKQAAATPGAAPPQPPGHQ